MATSPDCACPRCLGRGPWRAPLGAGYHSPPWFQRCCTAAGLAALAWRCDLPAGPLLPLGGRWSGSLKTHFHHHFKAGKVMKGSKSSAELGGWLLRGPGSAGQRLPVPQGSGAVACSCAGCGRSNRGGKDGAVQRVRGLAGGEPGRALGRGAAGGSAGLPV